MSNEYDAIVLGLGAMGSRIACGLIHAGHELVVFNRSHRKEVEELTQAGAILAESPFQVAGQVDIVITSLSDDEATADQLRTLSRGVQFNPELIEV